MRILRKAQLPGVLELNTIYLTPQTDALGNPVAIEDSALVDGSLIVTIVGSTLENVITTPGSRLIKELSRAEAISEFNSRDVSGMIQTALQNLPPTSSSLYFDTIADRDLEPAPSNGTFCLVSDATGDTTVDAGSALYFYVDNGTLNEWVKVAEYESMDAQVVIPNIAVIQELGDVSNQLTYKGSLVGGVAIVANEW